MPRNKTNTSVDMKSTKQTKTSGKKTQSSIKFAKKGTNKNYNEMNMDELEKECDAYKLPVRGTVNHLITQLNYNKLSATLLKDECRKNKVKMTGKKELLLLSLMFNNLQKSYRKSDHYIDEERKRFFERKSILTDKDKKLWEKNNKENYKDYYKKTIETRKEYTFNKELNVYLTDSTYNSFYKYVIEDNKDDRITRKYHTNKKVFEELTCCDIQLLKRQNLLYKLPTILEMNEPGDEKDNIRKRNSTQDDEPEEDINDYFHEIVDL